MSGRGSKPGERRGGRKKGSRNKAVIEREMRAKAALKAAEAGDMPLDVMLGVMRGNRTATPEQIAMAVAAAPYCHPKLSSVDMNAVVKRDVRDLSMDELLAIAAAGGTRDHPPEADSIEPDGLLN